MSRSVSRALPWGADARPSRSAAPSAMPGLPLGLVVATLRRHAIPIALLGGLGAVGAYAYARTLPKFYTASSLVAVAGSSFAIPELQGALRADSTADPMPIVRTEMQALTARDLVLRVVRELRLDQLPEFNSDLRPPTLTAKAKAWLQSFLPSVPAEPDAGAGDPEHGIVAAATSAIRIFQDNRSLAIDVGFVSRDPALSARVANTLVADYMAIRAARQTSANSGANEVLTQRIDQVRADIAGLEAKIQQLRNSNELVLLRAGSVGQQQLEDLVTAAAKATLERGQLEANYDRAASMAKQGSSAALANVLSSPTISQLREREAAASQRIAELSSRYGRSFPGVASAEAELAAAHAQVGQETQRIISSLGTQLRVARQREAEVQQQLDDARKAAVGSENARAELKQLQDEVASRQKLYQTMLERVQQTTGQPAGNRTPDVYVISSAAPPTGPSGPNMKMAAGFGGIAGLSLGCLLALARIRSLPRPGASDGSVPAHPVAGIVGTGLLRRARTGAPLTGPDAAALAAIANGWRALELAARPRVTLLSGAPGEDEAGVLAAALARATFEAGNRVLLLDANLDKPSAGPGVPGPVRNLVAMIDGEDWPDPAASGAPCLERYAASAPSPAAKPGLSGPVFINLLAQVRDSFDSVLVLAPAWDAAETAALARQADLTLLVVSGKTDVVVPGPGPSALVRVEA